MAFLTSSPYRVPTDFNLKVSRVLMRGLRPLVLNALVLGLSVAAVFGVFVLCLDSITHMIDSTLGRSSLAALIGGAIFVSLPLLLIFRVWKRVWTRIVQQRIEARSLPVDEFVTTFDEDGVTLKGRLTSHWVAWAAVTRVVRVDDVLVIVNGVNGLITPLASLGGGVDFAPIAARLNPEALAASSPEIRNARH